MEQPINEFFEDYKWDFFVQVDTLTQLRTQNFTQIEMALKLGVSLKTIQNFEKCRSLNGFLIFGYKQILQYDTKQNFN